MTDLEVNLVDLDSMHVVIATGFGTEPENEAWTEILKFANDHQLDPWDQTHRFFGFNNPDPDGIGAEYGYEQWMTVSSDINAPPPLQTCDVAGGQYAMIRIHGLDSIGPSWQYLANWCEEHGYEIDTARQPCLEQLLTPIDYPARQWEMNLYLAVAS